MDQDGNNQQNQSSLPTPEEALRYNKDALLAEIERRKKNIEIFKAEIEKDEAEIKKLEQIIAIINSAQQSTQK